MTNDEQAFEGGHRASEDIVILASVVTIRQIFLVLRQGADTQNTR